LSLNLLLLLIIIAITAALNLLVMLFLIIIIMDHHCNILGRALDHCHQCNNIFDRALDDDDDDHHHHCILKLQSRIHIMMIATIKSQSRMLQ
jgi:hypothetical protein